MTGGTVPQVWWKGKAQQIVAVAANNVAKDVQFFEHEGKLFSIISSTPTHRYRYRCSSISSTYSPLTISSVMIEIDLLPHLHLIHSAVYSMEN
jgi:hypothetical protein